jgi:hypothetical protein
MFVVVDAKIGHLCLRKENLNYDCPGKYKVRKRTTNSLFYLCIAQKELLQVLYMQGI